MNSTLPGCRTSYPSPRPLTQSCFSVPARTQSGLAWSAMQSHCNPPREDFSRAGAIAASTDSWSDLDGSSANRLRHLRAERCANWPPLLLTPFPPYRAFERTMGLIHPYPTPVATGSRLYMVHRSGMADALHEFATLQLYLHCSNHATDQYDQSGVPGPIGLTHLAYLEGSEIQLATVVIAQSREALTGGPEASKQAVRRCTNVHLGSRAEGPRSTGLYST